MPINNEIYQSPATKGHVGGVALDTSVALDAVITALRKLSRESGVDIEAELKTILSESASLDARFDALTGYTKE